MHFIPSQYSVFLYCSLILQSPSVSEHWLLYLENRGKALLCYLPPLPQRKWSIMLLCRFYISLPCTPRLKLEKDLGSLHHYMGRNQAGDCILTEGETRAHTCVEKNHLILFRFLLLLREERAMRGQQRTRLLSLGFGAWNLSNAKGLDPTFR